MYNAFWRLALFVRGQSFSVKTFDRSRNGCQVIREGAGNDFRGPSVQALPLPSRVSFSRARFFLCPLLPSKRLLRGLKNKIRQGNKNRTENYMFLTTFRFVWSNCTKMWLWNLQRRSAAKYFSQNEFVSRTILTDTIEWSYSRTKGK